MPWGEWTLVQCGASQVPITGLEDKRQITTLLAATKAGDTLPPQLIYTGKTDRCLPKNVDFPTGLDVTCNPSHRADNAQVCGHSAMRKKSEKKLLDNPDQKALLILAAAHRVDTVMQKLQNAGFVLLYIPAACTDKLQPLDLLVNNCKTFKDALKGEFHSWYSNEVVAQISSLENEGGEANISAVRVDLRLSVIKPKHVGWLIEAHKIISEKISLIKESFNKVGL